MTVTIFQHAYILFFRYNLVDRFKGIVVGFADGQALAADKCRTTVKSFSLRVLARVLLDADWALDSAAERATAAYKVAHHLSQGNSGFITSPTYTDLKNEGEQTAMAEIQGTFVRNRLYNPLLPQSLQAFILVFRLRECLLKDKVTHCTACAQEQMQAIAVQTTNAKRRAPFDVPITREGERMRAFVLLTNLCFLGL